MQKVKESFPSPPTPPHQKACMLQKAGAPCRTHLLSMFEEDDHDEDVDDDDDDDDDGCIETHFGSGWGGEGDDDDIVTQTPGTVSPQEPFYSVFTSLS